MIKLHLKGQDEVLLRVVLYERGVDTYKDTVSEEVVMFEVGKLLREENARHAAKPRT